VGARPAIVEAKRDEINELARRHHARSVSLFGSVARSDDDGDSDFDFDFLVEFEQGSSLFDLMDLQEALESLLDAHVDVVSVGGLKDRDDHIRREAVPI
jgi:predicted nucleotidyltransferase